ncbi:MAG: energy-coupling factor transporter ATPase [Candidatus Izemoplasmataceae bacterium]
MGIQFEHVSYGYHSIEGGLFQAIENINVSIDAVGEFITLIGETGSGKSTMVQHMNALMTPQSGQVTIFGVKLSKNMKKDTKLNPLRQKVGLVFQFPEYQLFEETVLKDIIFGPKNFKVPEKEAIQRAKEVIKLVGLDETYLERSPFNLSGGEKKRVSIAGILAMEPDILILDEPTSGLDPKGRDRLLDLFMDIHQKTKKTIIVITHDMNTVYQYASRVLVLNKGSLVYDGLPKELFSEQNIIDWNLDLPDILHLKKHLEEKYQKKLSRSPNSTKDLFLLVKEELI